MAPVFSCPLISLYLFRPSFSLLLCYQLGIFCHMLLFSFKFTFKMSCFLQPVTCYRAFLQYFFVLLAIFLFPSQLSLLSFFRIFIFSFLKFQQFSLVHFSVTICFLYVFEGGKSAHRFWFVCLLKKIVFFCCSRKYFMTILLAGIT